MLAGEKFIAKQVDKKKKKKLQKVEHKMLGWGRLLKHSVALQVCFMIVSSNKHSVDHNHSFTEQILMYVYIYIL